MCEDDLQYFKIWREIAQGQSYSKKIVSVRSKKHV